MTEPTMTPAESETVAPLEQTIDGMLPAPSGVLDSTVEAGLEIKVRSQWSYARRRFLRHRLAMAGLIGLVIICGAGVFANFIAPYSYSDIDLNNILHGPTTTAHHYFGTDEIGRDYFSRVIWGIRTSEEVGVFVAVVSSIIGLLVGAAAGYYGGWVDNLLRRLTDPVLTPPAPASPLRRARLRGEGGPGAAAA